jgi:hypothetical protein
MFNKSRTLPDIVESVRALPIEKRAPVGRDKRGRSHMRLAWTLALPQLVIGNIGIGNILTLAHPSNF